MAEKYFNKFPQITYSNTTCLDLTRRVMLETDITKSPSIYYPYAMKTGTRADLIAENYYQDPYYDWLIFLNNGFVDPYYDWYMTDYDFNLFLVKKYGSVETSQKKISHYELNYHNDETEVSVDYYDNHMANIIKKYYSPIFGYGTKIISYKRLADSTVRNTNRLVQLKLANTASFSLGVIVDVKDNVNAEIVGGGEITFKTGTSIVLKNINGELVVNNYVSNNIITSSTILYQPISDAEFVYWRAKTYYDIEFQKNDKNKNIRLIGANYAQGISEKLRIALKV